MELYFKIWVQKFGGTRKLADAVGLKEPTIRKWLRGQGAPEAKSIDTIIRLSKGRLTFKKIYDESTRNK